MSVDALVSFLRSIEYEGRAPAGPAPAFEDARAWIAAPPAELRPPLVGIAVRAAARLGVRTPPGGAGPLSAGALGLAAAAQALAAAGAGADPSGLPTAERLAEVIPTASGWDLFAYHGVLSALHRSLPPGSPARFAAASLVARSPLTALLWHADPGEGARGPAVALLLDVAREGHPLATAVARGWADGPDEAGSWRWRAFLLDGLARAEGGAACALDYYGHLALRIRDEGVDVVARAESVLRDPSPDASASTWATAFAAAMAPLGRLRVLGAATLAARGVPPDLAVRAARVARLGEALGAAARIEAVPDSSTETPENEGEASGTPPREESPWA
ncbi:hypothetical protein L6R50_01780 [Myxococcota bacterium]|nr:hypothetical protein [Myxococcota bacterium]